MVHFTKPFVKRLAVEYDIQVLNPRIAVGQNPLTFRDSIGSKDQVPNSVYFNTRSGSVTVGENTVFGEEVMVLTGKHLNSEESRRQGLPLHFVPSGRDVVIGKDCYVGSRAILIGPLSVGDRAVIGAGAVVTHDVPADAFVAGNPARVIRMLDIR